MSREKNEWLFNALLLLVIAALIALIGMQRFQRPTLTPEPSAAGDAAASEEIAKPETETGGASGSAEKAFPHLGASDPFRSVYTPPPPPPTRTPKPKPTPSLEAATKGWALQYPMRPKGKATIWVFSGTRKGEEHQISEDTAYTVQDRSESFEIRAKPGNDRYSVILYYEDQERRFSLLE